MSNFKKIVSVLLACMMVVSAAPLSMAYLEDDYVSGTDYIYDSASSVTNPTTITVDTYDTTEVIRIANSSNTTQNGTTIVAANSAGIATTSGIFANFAYGADAPTEPEVVCKIYGVSDANLISGISITCTSITGFSTNLAKSTGSDSKGSYVQLKWTGFTGQTVTVSDGTVITFTISFTFGGREYTTYAFSEVKNVVRPNGVFYYAYCGSGLWQTPSRAGIVTELLCAQSVPGFMASGGTNRSYIQYDASVSSGNALSGGGNDDTGSGSWLVSDSTNGGIVWFKETKSGGESGEWSPGHKSTTSTDSNRVCTTVYVDLGYDHLGQGTSGSLTNGLNMRIVMKPTEYSKFWYAWYQDFMLKANNNTSSLPGSTVTSVGDSSTGTWTLTNANKYRIAHYDNSSYGDASTRNYYGRRSDGTGGYVSDTDVSTEGCFVMLTFGGTGAKTSGTIWSFDYSVKTMANDTLNDSGRRIKMGSSMSVKFMTYDTTTLRAILNAIDTGTTYTYNGVTYGNKGAFPQESMYTGGWSSFLSAYQTAKGLIAKFNTSASEISSAISALGTAYNGLTGYQGTGTLVVKHCLVGTTTEIIPAQTFTVADTWANQSTSTNGAIKTGASYSVKAMVDSNGKCTLKGYEVSGVSNYSGTVYFSTSGASVYNGTTLLGDCVTFYYTYGKVTLNIKSGIWGDDNGSWVHYTTSNSNVRYNDDLDDSSTSINFSTLKAQMITQYGYPAHTVYGGMYADAYFSGTAVDGINVSGGLSQWRMPSTETTLYAKWNSKPVKLRVITSFGTEEYDLVSAQTPTMTDTSSTQNGGRTFSSVTFNQPSNPPTPAAGYEFINYYADANYTTPVNWPLTADYYGEEDYAITETGSSTDYNYVTVYARYYDSNYKISFDPMGGTIADGTTTNGYTISDNTLDFSTVATFPVTNIDYPTPTREGYIFNGWILADGTPVDGWTTGNATDGYEPVENGTHTMTSSVGFACYASWTPKTITLTYYHAIPSTETSAINSTNISGTNYYYQTQVLAMQQADASAFPEAPRRYGYEFRYWVLGGRKFDETSTYPADSSNVTAYWRATTDVAYAEITSYVNLAGTDTIADAQHDSANATTPLAMKGDTVKIQFNVGGNFYAGSTSFIFVYDADFYDLVTGVSAAVPNSDNTYIAGIHADSGFINQDGQASPGFYANTSTAVKNAYLNKMDSPLVDPYTGETITNPGFIQVTIDPVIAEMTNGYKTVSFNDFTDYLLQISLKIKSDTTKSYGSLWLPDELVRSTDNLAGDTYIAWNSSEEVLTEVSTTTVTFDTEPCSTVYVENDTRDVTTITLALPTDDNGAALGTFADGTTASKTYVGPEETEIATNYSDDGATYYETYSGTGTANVYTGIQEPVREGYHLIGWTKIGGSGSETSWCTDSNGLTGTYSYANADQDGNTYEAVWEGDPHTVTYIRNGVTLQTENVVYGQVGLNPPTIRNTSDQIFLGWTLEEVGTDYIDTTTYTVTDDVIFYAQVTTPIQDVTLTAVYTTENEGETTTTSLGTVTLNEAAQGLLGVELRTGYTLYIVSAMPETPVEGAQYILMSDIVSMFAGTYDGITTTMSALNKSVYEYDTDMNSELPIIYTVIKNTTSASNNINIDYVPTDVNVNFKSGNTAVKVAGQNVYATYTGTYPTTTDANGVYYWTLTGTYGTTYDWDAAIAGVQYPFGYNTISRWMPVANQGTYALLGNGNEITYYPTFTAATVNIHWLNNDGTADVATGSNLFTANLTGGKPSTAPTKSGYTFAGWTPAQYDSTAQAYVAIDGTVFYANNANTPAYNPSTYATNYVQKTGENAEATYDVYFLPVFNIDQFTISFESNGGSAVASITADYGATVTAPADPTRTGYSFDKWYSDSALENAYTFSTMPGENIILYAKWTANDYTVRFYNNDGTDAYTDVTVAYDSAITAPATDPTRTGYEFKGWAASATATEDDVITDFGNLTSTGNPAASYYAVWAESSYTITYISDGAEYASQEYDYGASVTAPADPTKTGYTFSGWSPAVPATMPAEDLTLTAQWTVNQYTITYNSDGATYTTQEYDYNASVTAPADPTKEGYTFGGWTPALPETMPAENLTVDAVWNVNQYTITFDSDGGSAVAAITQDYGTAVTAPTAPTKTGYTFNGWSPALPETMPAENMTVTAQWTVNQYTITFKDGTETLATITQDYGTDVTAPAAPTKTGYTFTGWSAAIPETMPATDMTIYANFTINQYTITFDTDGGSEVAAITQNYDTTVSAPADPTKEGYTFGGWYSDAELTTAYTFSRMPAENIIVYAKWTINQYTITFNTDGGSEVAAITQDYGTDVTAPAAPTKEGYTFSGWSPEVPATMPAENITVTAQWTINQYTITFDTDGGSEVAAITQNYDTTVSAPADPTKEGYTFGGWYSDAELTTAYTFSRMPAENIIVYAKWTINQYTITFVSNGGSEVAAITQDYGTAVTAPANPTRTGYSFDKWYSDSALTTEYTFSTMPAENIILYAGWNIEEYSISFETNGGSTIEPIVQDYGTTVSAPTAPTKEGYSFRGWYSDEELTTAYNFTTMPAENITVYAKWEINQYSVTFYQPDSITGEPTFNNGDTYVDPAYYDYGSTVTAPEGNPEVTYYTFVGWGTTANDEETIVDFTVWTVPAENTVLYPIYERVEVTLQIVTTGDNPPEIVTDDATAPVTGYIYNIGRQQTKAQVSEKLEVVGDGTLRITASKGKYCGTGTKIELIDNVTENVVEIYYIIVCGDVQGDAICNTADVSIAEKMYAVEENERTWFLTDKAGATDETIAENARKRECYELAADVNGNGHLDEDDTAAMELYCVGLADFAYDSTIKKYEVVE